MAQEHGRTPSGPSDVTGVLRAHRGRPDEALERLAPLVYDQLREIAHRQLRRERAGHTLQTTGLVHELFIRLVDAKRADIRDKSHFFALSARMMRHILLDYAKRRRAAKRGGGAEPLDLDEALHGPPGDRLARHLTSLIALDAALNTLATVSERQARTVECRFFAGMSVEETAEALDVSKGTVKRDWRLARAWLNRELV